MKFAHFSHVWNKPGMTVAERYEQLWRFYVFVPEEHALRTAKVACEVFGAASEHAP